MGNDRLNMTEASADLAALLERATPGPWFVAGVRVKLDRQDTHAICQYDDTLKRDMNIANVWYDPRTNAGKADAAMIARAPDLAAEVLRLRAEARESALQYLSDTGQMSGRIDELVAANGALAADNARLAKRVEDAAALIRRAMWGDEESSCAWLWLAGGAA